MKVFAELYFALGETRALGRKRELLVDYFRNTPPADAAYAVYFLRGGRLRQLYQRRELFEALLEASALPLWLIEDSYAEVGDLAETMTLLAPEADHAASGQSLAQLIEHDLLPLKSVDAHTRRHALIALWRRHGRHERLLLNKLITGGLRIGVGEGLLQQALARALDVPLSCMAERLLGEFAPTAAAYRSLAAPAAADSTHTPLPFYLASTLADADIETTLVPLGDWRIEWKLDGIRAQLIRHAGGVRLFSRGEEWLDGRFPELEAAAQALPVGSTLDGEIVALNGKGELASFSALQRRIGKRKPGAKLLAEVPVALIAFDLLRHDEQDLRTRPMHERISALQACIEPLAATTIRMMPSLHAGDHAQLAACREQARAFGYEGLMLKLLAGPYRNGRVRGEWFKWKLAPRSIDAVLIYAGAGHGKRASLHSDYTLALWQGDELVPVAKAYSGLSNAELTTLDRWIRAHTRERFGPVRVVEPVQVFEIAFEGVNLSRRHKSGVAVRFPRILRWRSDKLARDADQLETLLAMAR